MKTKDLHGAALDWAVTKCEYPDTIADVWSGFRGECHYSTDWAQGGPIIEREEIEVGPDFGSGWKAKVWRGDNPQNLYGPTPLIAAMRCYVASKLGDEVEIPAELMGCAK